VYRALYAFARWLGAALPILLLLAAGALVGAASCVTPTRGVAGTLDLPGWSGIELTAEDAPEGFLVQPTLAATITALDGRGLDVDIPLVTDASLMRLTEAERAQMAGRSDLLPVRGGEAEAMFVSADDGFDMTLHLEHGDRLVFNLHAGDLRGLSWFSASKHPRISVTADGTPARVTLMVRPGDPAEERRSFSGYLLGGRRTFDSAYVHLSGMTISELEDEGLSSRVVLSASPESRDTSGAAVGVFFSFDLSKPGSNSQAHTGLEIRRLQVGGAAGFLRVSGSAGQDQIEQDVLTMRFASGGMALHGQELSFKGRTADVSLEGDQLVPSLWGTFPEPAKAVVWIMIGALLAPAAGALLTISRWARGKHARTSRGPG
jgi:hypothetical protein